MRFTLTEGHFDAREEAFAEIASRGWPALELDVPAEGNELHWHDFDSVIFVLSGSPRVAFADGSEMECGAGARIEAPARVVHRELSSPYRAVMGFSIDPTEMTRPINKPVVELIHSDHTATDGVPASA
jgi:uncharacterized RmlC-like cupin family protein